MNKSWLIYLIIAFIAFISGCVGDYGGALNIKEIKDIDNGTYLEITPDELKEQPEIAKSIRGGEGCTKSDYGAREPVFYLNLFVTHQLQQARVGGCAF